MYPVVKWPHQHQLWKQVQQMKEALAQGLEKALEPPLDLPPQSAEEKVQGLAQELLRRLEMRKAVDLARAQEQPE